MNLKFKNPLIKKIIGIFFVCLGILGLFLPFLQGIVFILIGLMLLGNKKAKEQINKIRRWFKNKFGYR